MQTKVKDRVSLSEIWRTYQRALSKINYSNPHAPTSIGTILGTSTLAYDNNGNLLTFGTTTYAYDYRNRITSAGNGLATSTYAYDHTGQRVKVADGGTGRTTFYPTKYYNVEYNGSTLTKQTSHTFAGDTLLTTFETKVVSNTNSGTCVIPASGDFTLTQSCTIIGTVLAPASIIVPNGKVLTITATSTLLIDFKHKKLLVQKGGGTLIKKGSTIRQVKASDTGPQLYYDLTDHLGSVTVSTNTTGTVTELSDYYPYGSVRLDQKSGLTEQRKYIGQEYDPTSGLSYLNARYYDGTRGQFLSEDPLHLALGNTEQVKQLTGQDQQMYLADPQQLNSYSYALNNPITKSDPKGQQVQVLPPLLIAIGRILTIYDFSSAGVDFYDWINTEFKYPQQFSGQEKSDTRFKLGLDAVFGGISAKLEKGSSILFDALTTAPDIIEHYAGDSMYDKKDKDKDRPMPSVYGSGSSGGSGGNDFKNFFNGIIVPGSFNYGGSGSSGTGTTGGSQTVTVPGSNIPRSKDPVDFYKGQPVYYWGK